MAKLAAIHLSVLQQMVCMGPIIAYSGEIVGQLLPALEKAFPVCIHCVAVAGAFFCIPVLQRYGRKSSLQFGTAVLSALLLLIGVVFSQSDMGRIAESGWAVKALILATLLAIRFTFSFTLGPVVWIYVAEVVQPDFLPIPVMINWFSVGLVNMIFPVARNALGGNPGWLFISFGVYTLASLWVTGVVVIETRGKNEY